MWLSFTEWSSRNSEGRENKIEKNISVYKSITRLHSEYDV